VQACSACRERIILLADHDLEFGGLKMGDGLRAHRASIGCGRRLVFRGDEQQRAGETTTQGIIGEAPRRRG